MLLRLVLKNIISRKSSFVIVLFIATAISLFVVTNAVFDRTEHGVEEVFVNSFTGDFVIRPCSEIPLSLFGDETPVTGELTDLDCLIPYSEIYAVLKQFPSVCDIVPQVTGRAVVENDSNRMPLYLFGVNACDYMRCMSSLKIIAGAPYGNAEKGVMLLKETAQKLGVSVGDTLQFSVADGPSFRIRAAPVCAVYDYEVLNNSLEQYILVDPSTLRSLMDLSDTSDSISINNSKTELLDQSLDMDDLFSGAEDTGAIFEDVATSTENVVGKVPENCESSSWHFMIGRLKPEVNAAVAIRAFNKVFKKNGWPVEAVDWRTAAGRNAMYLYWMRIIFNAGILIVLCAGFIIINNTLVITVFDRIREIGTMRAVGASRRYITLQFLTETFIIAAVSGIAGCLFGVFFSGIIQMVHITFTNAFLIQLFGGTQLVTKVTVSNLCSSFGIALFLGIIGWIYPVQTALSVSPVQAIRGGIMFAFNLGLRSLFFRKRQYISLFIVCCFGVGISLTSLFVMNGMLRSLALKAKIYYGGDLQFIGGSQNLYFDDYKDIIQQLKTVFPSDVSITPRFDFDARYAALYFEGTGVRQRVIKGVEFDKEQSLFEHFNYISGSAHNMAGSNGILLSKPIADMLEVHTGDSVTLMLNTARSYMNTVTLVVQGIFNDSSLFGMYTSYMDFEQLKNAYGMDKAAANRITIAFKGHELSQYEIAGYQSALEKIFTMFPQVKDKQQFYDELLPGNLPKPTYALISLFANLQDVQVLIDAMHGIAAFIIAMLVLIIIAGISSTYRVLILKRSNEIGIYMALGMNRSGIRHVLLSETFVLLFSGCSAGLLLSLVLSHFIKYWNLSFIPAFDIFLSGGTIVPCVEMTSVVWLCATVIVTTVLSVSFAVQKSVSMTPVQALSVTE